MNTDRKIRMVALAAVAGLALAMTACGTDGDANADSKSEATPEQSESSEETAGTEPFGAACAEVPADGDGSFDGMSDDPVATAASANPLLSTLVEAVGVAELGDTLNSAQGITVFAPTNDAFAKIPQADLEAVLADKELLTSILTYHVVGETVTPEQLGTEGPFTTLQGEAVTVSGSGEDFTVNDESKVICGNVQTSNATVYIVDTVLMPPAE